MNYQRHYAALIERAKNRALVGYSERHHVIPKCLGGKDDKVNIVSLTPEEHYVAHLLLVKMHPGNHRLVWAASAMTNKTALQQRRNKMYGWLRRKFAVEIGKRNRGRKMSDEFREKMRVANTGKKRGPHSAETKAKMSEASRGRLKSPEHCAAMSASRVGKKRAPHRPETIEKIRKANIISSATRDMSHTQDESYRKTQSACMKAVWEKRKAGQLKMPVHKYRQAGE